MALPFAVAYLSIQSSRDSSCEEYQFYHPKDEAVVAALADDFTGKTTNTTTADLLIRRAVQKLDKTLETLLASVTTSPVPTTLSFGVVYNQQLIYYKGLTTSENRAAQQPPQVPNPHSIYRIGSISKVWAVLLAFLLRDKGILASLDATIHSLQANFTIDNPWGITPSEQAGHSLTVRQLASQISGLPRELPCGADGYTDCIGVTTNEMFARLAKDRLIHPTDTRPSYSNAAFAILGNVLSEYYHRNKQQQQYQQEQRHTKDTSYNQTLMELLLEPLGLQHTGMYISNAEQAKYAMPGYYSNGEKAPYIDIGWGGPCGNMFSSVHDLAQMMQQFFAAVPSKFESRGLNGTKSSNGRRTTLDYNFVVSPQSLREMMRPIFWNPDGISAFGAPWEMRLLGKRLVRSKGGNIDGFSSSMAMLPEMKLGVVALSNHDGLDGSIFTFSALQTLVPAFEHWMHEASITEFRADKPTNFQDYLGNYMLDDETSVFELSVDHLTTNIMIFSKLFDFWGILQWQGGEDMIVHNLNSDTNPSCMVGALVAIDGLTLRFVRGHDGSVIGVEAIGFSDDFLIPKEKHGRKETFSRKTTFLRKRKDVSLKS